MQRAPCASDGPDHLGFVRPSVRDGAVVGELHGESRLTAAIPMENPCCSCKLTRAWSRCPQTGAACDLDLGARQSVRRARLGEKKSRRSPRRKYTLCSIIVARITSDNGRARQSARRAWLGDLSLPFLCLSLTFLCLSTIFPLPSHCLPPCTPHTHRTQQHGRTDTHAQHMHFARTHRELARCSHTSHEWWKGGSAGVF